MKESVEFADVRRVVTFCKAGWKAAREHGVPRTAIIRTFAPAFFNFSEARVEPFTFDNGDPIAPHRFGKELQETCRHISEALHEHSALIDRIPTVIATITRRQHLLRLANTLCPADLNEPLALAIPVLGDGRAADQFLTQLDPLFADHPACQRIEFRVGQIASRGSTEVTWAKRLESLRDRIGFDPLRTLSWPLVMTLGANLPTFYKSQVGLLSDDNTLIRETALSFTRRGYPIHRLPKFESIPANDPLAKQTREILTPLLGRFIAAWSPSPLRNIVLKEILSAINVELSHYLTAVIRWRAFFDEGSKHWIGVLANVAKNPEQHALFQVCRERNLFFATFQHGLSREICMYPRYSQSTNEMTTSTHFFCFNEVCAQVARSGTGAKGEAIPIGPPRQILRVGHHRKPTRRLPPVFYVSTNLYGTLTTVIRGRDTDIDMARTEHDIITKVLAGVQQQILYKPYPDSERLFLDPDPCLTAAKNTENIKVYGDQKDLALLLPDARLIITARATSTLGWCVATRRPVVFIDMPHSLPLLPELRDTFSAGTFLFDSSQPGFHKRLRSFLDRPLEEIEQEHASTKTKGREYLLNKYYQNQKGMVGRLATDVLEAYSS